MVALLGSEDNNGRFEVDEICFAGVPKIPVTPSLIDEDRYTPFLLSTRPFNQDIH